MHSEDYKNLISIIATLIVVILSSCVNNPIIQIIFIIIFIVICCFIFSYLDDKAKSGTRKNWKRNFICICCGIEGIIIIYSLIGIGSFGNFIKHMERFFSDKTASVADTPADYEDMGERMSEIRKSIKEIEYNISYLLNYPDIHLSEDINEEEVNEILSLIAKSYVEHQDELGGDIKDDIYLFEIFYKIYISGKPYYYCNLIEAFNQYGIDTKMLEINENVLIIWDIQKLYAIYNMQQSLIGDLDSDESLEMKRFYYDNYKVKMDRYSDTINYGTWNKNFSNRTPKYIYDQIFSDMMECYKKFIINFSWE